MKKKITTKLTHLDRKNKAVMVDISNKILQKRFAIATGKILLNTATIKLVKDNQIKKGDVLSVARIAGIQAAKTTAHLIPLCHNITLNNVEVDLDIKKDSIIATSKIFCIERTGAEMEALTTTSVTLLTIYDMCKAVDKNMVITDIHLVKKVKTNV